MDQPLVSILMTAFNRQQFIGEAIESVLASTYQNWELIIVDDCSKDDTVSIAKSYEEQDNRISVYVNEKNLGDYPNRNKAASYAKGDYLKYLDADDVIYPHSLAIMVEMLNRHPDAGMALSQNIIDDLKPYPIYVKPQDVARAHFLKNGIIMVGPSAAIIRRNIFEKLNGFSGKQYIGDTELWMKISFAFPIVLMQPSLVWWRIHEGQQIVSEKKDNNVMIQRHYLNKEYINNSSTPLSEKEKILAIKKLNRRLIVNSYRVAIRAKSLPAAIRILKKSQLSLKDFIKAVFH